jgi:hypothetical protein
MTETELMRDILVAANQLPDALFWRVNVGLSRSPDGRRVTRYGLPGQADIAGVVRGHHVEIEVKTPTGRQSRQQIRWQRAVERAGGTYVLARSVDEALAALECVS